MPVDNSMLDPELQAQLLQEQRRRAIANALMQQSQEPLPTAQTAGRYVVPVSPFQGLAKMGQAFAGSLMNKQADDAQLGIAQAQQTYNRARVRALLGPQASDELVNSMTPDAASQIAVNRSEKDAEFQRQKDLKMIVTPAEQETMRHNKAEESVARANAGLGTDGLPSGNDDVIADKIGKGELPPLSGFALAKPRGMAIMAKAAQKYPDYDATAYGAKQKAQKDFSTGQQGNALRSIGVANVHLGQLDGLVDALGNGDTKILNRAAQTYAEQTGGTAPTNFDAIKDVVGAEVMKAIVAGGGGVSERQELRSLLDNAKSPQQLRGVIRQYRELMSAQREGLRGQYEASGLKDFDTRFPTPKQPQTTGPKKISSDAEYESLPPGSEFIAPDGSHRRKP